MSNEVKDRRVGPDYPGWPDYAARALDELLRCNRCGFCVSVCPTYRATQKELFVARGRNFLAGKLLGSPGTGVGDQAEPVGEEDFVEPLFQCLLCGACEVVCRSSVKTNEVMVATRSHHWEKRGRPAFLRLFFDQLLANPRLLRRVVRLLGLGKRSGLSSLARGLGLLRWINARLATADELVAQVPRSFLRDRLHHLGFRRDKVGAGGARAWVLPRPHGATGPRLLYFIGCGTDLQQPQAGEAALRVLNAGGCELIVPEHLCCGLPPFSYGDLDAARSLAARNVELLSAFDAEAIVTDCGSCSAFLSRYGELLGLGAAAISAKVRDFTQVAMGLALPRLSGPVRVTYHDPCHLVRGKGVRDEPRELLRRAGCELVELAEADWCCGGAGTYNIMHPELSLAVLERKMANIAATGAPVVATSCPACIIQLSYGARRFGPKIEVMHIAQLLARGVTLAD
ncbi:MAG: (Fe-S)-binding protein [Armatimonadetes bacterium]|nr:(Fe-S)-binding protein [Armatimonadota bacterium]